MRIRFADSRAVKPAKDGFSLSAPLTVTSTATAATGQVIFNSNPTGGKVRIGDAQLGFGIDITIGADKFETADNLTSLINGSSGDYPCTASHNGSGTVTLTASEPGTAGNDIVLTTTNTSGAVSVVPFSGGTD